MRLCEIASAAEQLALWKLISNNVWAAVAQQARQEAEQQAAKMRAAKHKPKRGGRAKVTAAPYAAPPKPLPEPKPLYPTPSQSPQQKPAAAVPQPQLANRSTAPLDDENLPPATVPQFGQRH
jgi:hypothetical protein